MDTQVAGALLYLRWTSLRNALRARLLRLRQPKYLFGGVVGIAYIYFFFIRAVAGSRPPGPPPAFDFAGGMELMAAATVFVLASLNWLIPKAPIGLAFSESEIAFLFPAPIRQRTLIHYRLLSSQLTLLFTALILGLVSSRWGIAGSGWTRVLAWWLVVATMSLHATAASFAIGRMANIGIGPWLRRVLVLAFIAAWFAAAIFLPGAPAAIDAPNLWDFIKALTDHGPLHWLFLLPRLLIAPMFETTASAFTFALLVFAGHYAWVLYSATAFEETSLASAERRAARLAALGSGKVSSRAVSGKAQRDPFTLRTSGRPMDRSLPDRSPNAARAGAQERPSGAGAGAQERPEIAFLWKNLLSGSAFFRPRALLIVAFVIVVVCRWLGSREALEPFAAGVFALAWIIVLFTVLLGAQVARNDLRNDLPNADILKTYPLRGWQIVLGQVLAPTFMLASVLWLALLAATLTVPDARLEALAEYKTLLALGLAILIPPFCCIQLLVMNGLTLLFPAWIQALANRNDRGLDMLGQRILFMAAQLIVFALAFVPALVVGAVVVLVTKWVLGAIIAAVLALTAVVAVLVFEIAALVAWLGNRFERFDLSTELRP